MSKNRADYMKSYREKKRSETTEATKLLAEITKSYKANRALIEKAMAEVPVGTRVYLDHISALAKLDRSHREELVERGLSPENLGVATRPAFHFIAVIGTDGTPFVHEMKEGQMPPQNAQRKIDECPECRARVVAALEAEFPTDVPMTLPREDEE